MSELVRAVDEIVMDVNDATEALEQWCEALRLLIAEMERPRFQRALDRAWFALKPRKPTWRERLLRVLVWP